MNQNISRALMILLVAVFTACGGGSDKQSGSEQQTAMETDKMSAPKAKLNINTASGDEFRNIPNVGDNMVHEFEEYRPYVSIQQFRKEIGKYVDSSRVAAYEQYIFVPIHRNDSDVATLLQIPGLEQAEADRLATGRPYDSNQAFFDSLSSYISEDEMATARSYMKSE